MTSNQIHRAEVKLSLTGSGTSKFKVWGGGEGGDNLICLEKNDEKNVLSTTTAAVNFT